MRRKIVAGNWKLHGDRQFALDLMEALAAHQVPAGVERIILPPLPYLGELVEHFGDRGFEFGAQDVSAREKGAYTGEVSAADRKSTRLNSSHSQISYAVFCLKKKTHLTPHTKDSGAT